ncbi:MAG: Gfo/Idh/MocA family protein [Lautropia sp.]
MTTATNPLRIAVVGAGLIGREHVALIREHPQTTLAAIADVSADGRTLAQANGVPFHEDYVRMLDVERIDGVVVALPNQLHLSSGLQCIERRLPMLMEKPLADTLPAALELMRAVEASGVPMLVGHHRRHSPDMSAARDAIANGELGELVAVSGLWWMHKNERYFDATWRRSAGGGPLLINLIHDVDCLRMLCGEIDDVQAMVSSRARGFEVEDTAAVILRFANGAIGTFSLSDAVPSPWNWESSSGQALYFPPQREDAYFIGGRKASLSVPGLAKWQHLSSDGRWQDPLVRHQVRVEIVGAYRRQLDNLVGVIRGTAAPTVSARDGFMTLATVLAIRRAGETGRVVRVADLVAEAEASLRDRGGSSRTRT